MKIAVDFDGTIVESDFPNIGKPHLRLIEVLKKAKKEGHILILWTCRQGEHLIDAVDFCKTHDLVFDGINENVAIPEGLTDSRKIGADIYIDDRAIPPESIDTLTGLLQGECK